MNILDISKKLEFAADIEDYDCFLCGSKLNFNYLTVKYITYGPCEKKSNVWFFQSLSYTDNKNISFDRLKNDTKYSIQSNCRNDSCAMNKIYSAYEFECFDESITKLNFKIFNSNLYSIFNIIQDHNKCSVKVINNDYKSIEIKIAKDFTRNDLSRLMSNFGNYLLLL